MSAQRGETAEVSQGERAGLRDQLVHALAGRYVNVIQRRPDMFVHVVGPLTATSVDELADALLPVVRTAIAGGAADTLERAEESA